MKILMLNGSPHEAGSTFTALKAAGQVFAAQGVESEIVQIGKKPLNGCIACGYCGEHKRCVFKDDGVNDFIEKAIEADAIIIGSPTHFANPSGALIAFLDRVFFAYGMRNFDGKLGAAVVSCRRGGASAAFDVLNKYFTISRMPVVSSQYWNQVHGNFAEQTLQDEEGIQTVETLADQMVWLLKCIEAGRREGIVVPAKRDAKHTNFIR
ncbi:MAG: flavodoxin family protein [Lactobacillales bacterium]|jgi:multimeric flavodoxin WrbA|nr:flavodoxin family protein [Lactobacillales bacterium]